MARRPCCLRRRGRARRSLKCLRVAPRGSSLLSDHAADHRRAIKLASEEGAKSGYRSKVDEKHYHCADQNPSENLLHVNLRDEINKRGDKVRNQKEDTKHKRLLGVKTNELALARRRLGCERNHDNRQRSQIKTELK